MKVLIIRKYYKAQTAGDLFVYENGAELFKCKTLELPWKENEKKISCIPEGQYTVKKINRPNGKVGLHVQNVTGRTAILIHTGNIAAGDNPDILGCILVGHSYGYVNDDKYLDIKQSQVAFDALYKVLPKEFQLIII